MSKKTQTILTICVDISMLAVIVTASYLLLTGKLHCMLKEGNNYWICEFVCKHRSYDSLEKSMLQWADSITFDQQ